MFGQNKKRVLIVEDDEMLLSLLLKQFKIEKFKVGVSNQFVLKRDGEKYQNFEI